MVIIQQNKLFHIIKYLFTANLLYIIYLLIVGWQGAWSYRVQIPFLYIASPEFYSWKLYSAAIFPGLVTLAWWKPCYKGWAFLQASMILEILKHIYLIIHGFLIILMEARVAKELPAFFVLEILLLVIMVAIIIFLRSRRDLFLGVEERIKPFWKTVTLLLIVLVILVPYLPRAEYVARINILKFGLNSQKKIITQDDWVRDVALSSDEKYITMTSLLGSQKVYVWDVAISQVVKKFEAENTVHGVAFSPDDKYLVIGRVSRSNDQKQIGIEIWDMATGQKIERLRRDIPSNRPQNNVSDVLFSPMGTYLATWVDAEKNGIEIWDFRTGALVKTLTGGLSPWLSDKCYLVREQEKLIVRELEPDRVVKTINFKGRQLVRFAASPDGQYVAVNILQNPTQDVIEVWNIETEQHLFTVHLSDTGHIGAMAFSPDSRYLVAGGHYSSEIKFWDVINGQVVRELQHPAVQISVLIFSKDGKKLVSGGERMVAIWNLE